MHSIHRWSAFAAAMLLSACGRFGSETVPRAFDGPLVCGKPAARIAAIQGTGLMSPVLGQLIELEATLTAKPSGFGGFFVQAPPAEQDQDRSSSEALFVAHQEATPRLKPGTRVRVRGRVAELGTPPETTTALVEVSQILVCAASAPVAPRTLPAIPSRWSDWEAYESEWLELPGPVTVIGTDHLTSAGQILVSLDGRDFAPTESSPPGSKADALAADNQRTRLILDDAQVHGEPKRLWMLPEPLTAESPWRVDSQLRGIQGILEQRDQAWRLQLTAAIKQIQQAPRPATPPEVDGDLRIASFNVNNYFNGDGHGGGFPTARGANSLAAFKRQRAKVLAALTALDADVIALMEVENDGLGADSAIADLSRSLNGVRAEGEDDYDYVRVGDAAIGTDLITVGLLYRRSRVQTLGAAAVLDEQPFQGLARPPLAQSFLAKGVVFTVIANHFKSKGGCPKSASPDAAHGDGQGCWNASRVEMARRVFDWMQTDPTDCGSPAAVLIGDFNAYAQEDPLRLLRDRGLVDLVETYAREPAYSYQYEGASGRLDHAFATPAFAALTSGAAEWHINADESPALDYAAAPDAATRRQRYRADPYRSSDHDPLLLGLNLPEASPALSPPSKPPTAAADR